MTLLEQFENAVKRVREDQIRMHKHRCDKGHVWSHSGHYAGDESAHKCPWCGTGPYWERA